ncbi:MAG: aminotransferase class III-fold pyridoxal phosphate-dependent enzyme, partial [Thermodesulfovibrionales bacterium]|nr:aminotransferase class III-fold pyridoxal phosphate-dependent enzyme [Thermodesulfovibrionales bacterium]
MKIPGENRHLEEADKKYIWHPFTQMKDWLDEKPVIIAEGRDCFIKDIYGRWYLDAVSSMWVNIHGHRKKEIDEAIKEQTDRISHSTLLGLSNVPAIRLAERLVQLVNASLVTSHSLLSKVFYSDNGSTSVEVALKMAFQYWLHKGVTGKNTFLSLKNAYHGDTLGAVSVGGIETFHKVFSPLLFKTYNAPSPYCYRCESGLTYPGCKTACLKKMEEILRKHSSEIAAVIIEPLVQAAGGMIVSPQGYLKGVRDLCIRYKVVMIADEV